MSFVTIAPRMAVRYFDRDFDWDTYVRDVVPSLSLPPIKQPGAPLEVEKSDFIPSESKENENLVKGESEKQRGRSEKRRESRKKSVSHASLVSTEASGAGHEWDSFFAQHTTGAMYKPRRYIHNEFRSFFEELLAVKGDLTLLEVGCGYGCTMFPLLENFLGTTANTIIHSDPPADISATETSTSDKDSTPIEIQQAHQMKNEESEIFSLKQTSLFYFATDYAAVALNILRSNSLCARFSSCFETALWDVTLPPPAVLAQRECDAVLAVFALSAVTPDLHLTSLQHIFDLLAAGSVSNGGDEMGNETNNSEKEERRRRSDGKKKKKFVFFRDYGLHDMTMYRHTKRLDECTFERQDGTICYYFSIEYMRTLAEKVGFTVREIDYATVINRNRKTNQALHRVFLHAVLEIEI